MIVVGTHLDQIEASQRDHQIETYHRLIIQSFTNHRDLPNFWPHIESIHFVGLLSRFTHDMNVDELRECIYDTALNMELRMGKCFCELLN